MTLAELLESKTKAGERYAAAAKELHEALINLAAFDEALMNANVGFDARAEMRTFFNVPQNLGTFAHPTYAPLDAVTCWRDEIKSRRDDIIKSFNK